MEGSWQKLSEQKIKGGYRKIILRRFRLPGGDEVDYEINADKPGVTILPLTRDYRVILVKQFRVGPEKLLLELPGGLLEEGEEPQEAAARELLEETGYKGEMTFLTELLHNAYSTHIKHVFLALNCEKIAEPQTEANGEPLESLTMSLEEFRDHLRSGQLTDVATGYLGLDYLKLL